MATILMIDDSALARNTVRLALEQTNHVLVEAADGVDGLEAAIRLRPDVILTGLRLPGEDGIGILRQVREQGLQPAAVVVSGRIGAKTRRACEAVGAVEFIERPLRGTEIRRAIESALRVVERAAA